MDFKEIETLVSDAKRNEKCSKEKLIEEFRPFIINLSNKTFINGYDKQDIQNECYKTLFKCICAYKLEKHRFVAYATNGIKNNLNDLIKKSKNRSSCEGTEALTLSDNLEHTLMSHELGLDEMLCNKAQIKTLSNVIDLLNSEERELIIFVFFKNNSLKSYAFWKNMCYSTASRKKKSILKKMQKNFIGSAN